MSYSITTRDHKCHSIVATAKLEAVHKFCCGTSYHETDIIMVHKNAKYPTDHQVKDV